MARSVTITDKVAEAKQVTKDRKLELCNIQKNSRELSWYLYTLAFLRLSAIKWNGCSFAADVQRTAELSKGYAIRMIDNSMT